MGGLWSLECGGQIPVCVVTDLWGHGSCNLGIGNRDSLHVLPYTVELPFKEMNHSPLVRLNVESKRPPVWRSIRDFL